MKRTLTRKTIMRRLATAPCGIGFYAALDAIPHLPPEPRASAVAALKKRDNERRDLPAVVFAILARQGADNVYAASKGVVS